MMQAPHFGRTDARSSDGSDIRKNRRLAASAILACVLVALCSSLSAQNTLVVGYTDWLDERSETTGMRKALKRVDGIEMVAIDLNRPESFDLDRCDALYFSSFIEKHPRWDEFVRRERERIFRFVRSGGVVVVMARHRDADEVGRPGERERLEPPEFRLSRGGEDPDFIYVDSSVLKVWEEVGDRGGSARPGRMTTSARRDDERIRNSPMASKSRFTLDCFSSWNRSLVQVSARGDDPDDGPPAAVQGTLGKGWLLYFQMMLDKVDASSGTRTTSDSMSLSRQFFDAMIAWQKSLPRRDKSKSTLPEPEVDNGRMPGGSGRGDKPDGGREPVRVPDAVPTPVPVPVANIVSGRVFADGNGNGKYEIGEESLSGVRLGDYLGLTETDARGFYAVETESRTARLLTLEVPDGYRPANRTAFWRRFAAGQIGRVTEDFALRPREQADRAVVLAVALPDRDDDALLARFESELRATLAALRPEVFVLLENGTGDVSSRFRARAAALAASADIELRYAASRRRNQTFKLDDTSIDAQPPRQSIVLAGRHVVLTGDLGDYSWSSWAARHPPESVFICPAPPTKDRVERLARGVIIAPADGAMPEGDRIVLVPALASADAELPRLVVRWRRGEEPAVELVDPSADLAAAQEREEVTPVRPPAPRHPLVSGSLDDAVKSALGDK